MIPELLSGLFCRCPEHSLLFLQTPRRQRSFYLRFVSVSVSFCVSSNDSATIPVLKETQGSSQVNLALLILAVLNLMQ